jgi:hypothetical protein
VPAWECLPAAELAGSAEPILEPQLWWPSTQGQFWRAPGKPAFGRSGMRKPTKPERRASRSALGVLQLAYFSMRCGLLPGIKVRRTLSKIVPCGLSWVNAETGPRGYLWHGTETFTCPLIVQLYESDLPAAERPGLDCLLKWFQPRTREPRRCHGSKLFRLQLHQNPSYTSHVCSYARWRDRSAVSVADLVALWEAYEAEGGKSSVTH